MLLIYNAFIFLNLIVRLFLCLSLLDLVISFAYSVGTTWNLGFKLSPFETFLKNTINTKIRFKNI